MMNAKNEAELIEELGSALTHAKKAIAKFAEAVLKDPGHAMRWSLDTFEQVAKVEVYGELHRALTAPDTKATLANVREHVLRTALRKARWPERSTSPVANLHAECVCAAWAALADEMGGAS